MRKNILNTVVALFILSMLMTSCNNILPAVDTGSGADSGTFENIPGSYIVKSNAEEIIIPFELYAGNKPMIKGSIQGVRAKFLIDNGKLWDDIWFYNGETDSIGLHYLTNEADSIVGIGKNNANQIFEGNQISLDFEQVQFQNQPTLISPPEAGYASFFPGINGQVSSMLFKHFVVCFDFEKSHLQLIKAGNFIPSEKQKAVKMHKRENGSYCIPFEIVLSSGLSQEVMLDIDIGTVFPLYLISNGQSNISVSENAEKHFIGMGASGEIYGYSDTLKELRFSRYQFEHYPSLIVNEESNAYEGIVEFGTFGIELMKQFTVTFDYFNELIYFEPNKNFTGTVMESPKPLPEK